MKSSCQNREVAAVNRVTLHIDCFSGIAGDMFLGAMFDLGVPVDVVLAPLKALPLPAFALHVKRRTHCGIDGCDVQVVAEGPVAHHTTYAEIRTLIEGAALDERARMLALAMFSKLAAAEAKIHGTEIEQVAFHEVGALDSIVDILGSAIAISHLNPQRITCRSVPVGHGWTTCSHGRIPVPAPAALEILTGVPVEDGGVSIELCTPTGAAIVATAVDTFCEMPNGSIEQVGYGAGDKDISDRPNHLRLVTVMEAPQFAKNQKQRALVIEANIDDMTPELSSYVLERLYDAGAKDVWFTPVTMKKGRPALAIGMLADPVDAPQVASTLLRESTTIGLRMHEVMRHVLTHKYVEVQTPHGSVRIKEAWEGEEMQNAAPEFEDCKRVAKTANVPLMQIYTFAIACYENARNCDEIYSAEIDVLK